MTISDRTRGLRAGYDFCGYGEECVCALHGPCDCRDDDLGPFDEDTDYIIEIDAERSEYGIARRLALLRGGKLVEISGEPYREIRG